MTRFQSALRIQIPDANNPRIIRHPSEQPARLRAVASAEAPEGLEDARFAEIEDIYLSGMLRGLAETKGTRH